jgi:hypothetical protein
LTLLMFYEKIFMSFSENKYRPILDVFITRRSRF